MLGNKALEEIENLKMATKGLIHYFFCYLLIYDEMSTEYCLVSCENWCCNSENGLKNTFYWSSFVALCIKSQI